MLLREVQFSKFRINISLPVVWFSILKQVANHDNMMTINLDHAY